MGHGIRILLIEDSEDIQVIVRITLETTGQYSVIIAGSGAEALRIVAAEQPDLILLDVMMPGMDGVETLRRLRAIPAAADIPVIFMTAKVLEHELTMYRTLGALGVIGKPFDPVVLPDGIRTLWESRPGPSGGNRPAAPGPDRGGKGDGATPAGAQDHVNPPALVQVV